MSVAITFSGMLARRPTVSDLFRRPERENRPLYTVSSVGDVQLAPAFLQGPFRDGPDQHIVELQPDLSNSPISGE